MAKQSANRKTQVASAIVTTQAPSVPPAIVNPPAPVMGELVPLNEAAIQQLGEDVARSQLSIREAGRRIAEYLLSIKADWETYLKVRGWFTTGHMLVGKSKDAARKTWEQHVRDILVAQGALPQSTKSSAKRKLSKVQEALAKLDAKALETKLGEAMAAKDHANVALYSGAISKREKEASAATDKKTKEARSKAWTGVKDRCEDLNASELMIVFNFLGVLVESRKDAAKLKALAKTIKAAA
jgi:hypothetical protein